MVITIKIELMKLTRKINVTRNRNNKSWTIDEIGSYPCWIREFDIKANIIDEIKNLRKFSLILNLNNANSRVSEDRYSKVEKNIKNKKFIYDILPRAHITIISGLLVVYYHFYRAKYAVFYVFHIYNNSKILYYY